MNPKCYYLKNDIGSAMSAAIVRHRHRKTILKHAENGFDVEKDDVVYILGCIPPDTNDLQEIIDKSLVFYLIAKGNPEIVDALRVQNESRLNDTVFFYVEEEPSLPELTFQSLIHNDIPDPIRLLGEYLKNGHISEKVLAFQYGVKAVAQDPQEEMRFWRRLILNTPKDQEYFGKLIKKGEVILKYLRNQEVQQWKW